MNEQKIAESQEKIKELLDGEKPVFIYNITNQESWSAAFKEFFKGLFSCLLYTSPSPRDVEESRMPSSA